MKRFAVWFCWLMAIRCAHLVCYYQKQTERWALRAHKYAMPKREQQDYLEQRLQPVSPDVEEELQRQREWEKSHL